MASDSGFDQQTQRLNQQILWENTAPKQKIIDKWNKAKNIIKITFRIKLNITHLRKKESVKIKKDIKIKILRIKMYFINRINSN